MTKKVSSFISYSEHKHQTGERIIAMVDKNGYVIAPLATASVNIVDMSLFPKVLNT